MSHAEVAHLAQTWGLVFLAILFIGAVVYALWPSNREKFKRAAKTPLEDEDDDDLRA
jgi:cytochrome c oxidase cbb3-type subunit 4